MKLVQQLTELVDLHTKYSCKITLAEFSQVFFNCRFALVQSKSEGRAECRVSYTSGNSLEIKEDKQIKSFQRLRTQINSKYPLKGLILKAPTNESEIIGQIRPKLDGSMRSDDLATSV